LKSCLWRIVNYFVPNSNVPTALEYVSLNLKESYFVIIKEINTFNAVFVCEGIPDHFSKEANTFGISLFPV